MHDKHSHVWGQKGTTATNDSEPEIILICEAVGLLDHVEPFSIPFWVPIIIRHLLFRVPKGDHNFDNHPHKYHIVRTPVPK